MRRVWVLVVALLSPGVGAAQTASERLERLAAETQERILDLFPVGEIFGRGAGPRQDRLELSFTEEHRERQRAHHRWVLKELEAIAQAELGPSEKLTHALLAYRARDALEWLAQPFHQPHVFIHLNGGVAFNLVQMANHQPLRSEADYRAWFRRLARYPAFLADIERVMREGMAAGNTTPRVIVERTASQLEALAPAEMEKSTLWKPAAQFGLEQEYRKLLAEEVFPALRRLAAFARNEYLPRARTSDGYGALPGGERMYRQAVKSATTTDLTPDEIHRRGLAEVKRIQASFRDAMRKAGYDGPMKGVHRWLATNPQNYPFASADEVIAHLNALHARIEPQMARLFGRMPKARFEIRLADPAIAGSVPAQYWWPSEDGRPGVFYMPVVNPRRVSTFALAALLAHEGMPGHHMESVKLELKAPEFRRRLSLAAFSEGWALYAESLGHELGLYTQPLDLAGRYSMELFRAGRLVVDTGLHAKGWTREQAVGYLVDECGSTKAGATNEVLRYMAWPGQALAYKLGELTILELRAKAERALGARFDPRAFHDALLEEGHLPMAMLQERMQGWIVAQQRQ
jgi:uncharacterized protein (DUF885 family)